MSSEPSSSSSTETPSDDTIRVKKDFLYIIFGGFLKYKDTLEVFDTETKKELFELGLNAQTKAQAQDEARAKEKAEVHIKKWKAAQVKAQETLVASESVTVENEVIQLSEDRIRESFFKIVKRFEPSEEQVKKLRCLYFGNRYPDFETRELLAREIGLSESYVQVWFNLRRAKERRGIGQRTQNGEKMQGFKDFDSANRNIMADNHKKKIPQQPSLRATLDRSLETGQTQASLAQAAKQEEERLVSQHLIEQVHEQKALLQQLLETHKSFEEAPQDLKFMNWEKKQLEEENFRLKLSIRSYQITLDQMIRENEGLEKPEKTPPKHNEDFPKLLALKELIEAEPEQAPKSMEHKESLERALANLSLAIEGPEKASAEPEEGPEIKRRKVPDEVQLQEKMVQLQGQIAEMKNHDLQATELAKSALRQLEEQIEELKKENQELWEKLKIHIARQCMELMEKLRLGSPELLLERTKLQVEELEEKIRVKTQSVDVLKEEIQKLTENSVSDLQRYSEELRPMKEKLGKNEKELAELVNSIKKLQSRCLEKMAGNIGADGFEFV